MTIKVKIIEDSLCYSQKRLTTFELYYPRFIHAQLMTHRQFSRNAASSRAIPLKRTIEMVKQDPVIPVKWGKNQKGMRAKEELQDKDLEQVKELWENARLDAIKHAELLETVKLHKELANRVLEPFLHINVVVSSTEWDNFFALRCSDEAQPEIQYLALEIRKQLYYHTPLMIDDSDWHLPYVLPEEHDKFDLEGQKKISVARCARVSYKTFDTNIIDTLKDFGVYSTLLESRHLSPFEHVATPSDNPKDWANFKGWKQLRKEIE